MRSHDLDYSNGRIGPSSRAPLVEDDTIRNPIRFSDTPSVAVLPTISLLFELIELIRRCSPLVTGAHRSQSLLDITSIESGLTDAQRRIFFIYRRCHPWRRDESATSCSTVDERQVACGEAGHGVMKPQPPISRDKSVPSCSETPLQMGDAPVQGKHRGPTARSKNPAFQRVYCSSS